MKYFLYLCDGKCVSSSDFPVSEVSVSVSMSQTSSDDSSITWSPSKSLSTSSTSLPTSLPTRNASLLLSPFAKQMYCLFI